MSSDEIETIETNFNHDAEIIVTQVDHLTESQKSQTTSEPEKKTSEGESPVKSDNSTGSGNQRIKAPLASEEALEMRRRGPRDALERLCSGGRLERHRRSS